MKPNFHHSPPKVHMDLYQELHGNRTTKLTDREIMSMLDRYEKVAKFRIKVGTIYNPGGCGDGRGNWEDRFPYEKEPGFLGWTKSGVAGSVSHYAEFRARPGIAEVNKERFYNGISLTKARSEIEFAVYLIEFYQK